MQKNGNPSLVPSPSVNSCVFKGYPRALPHATSLYIFRALVCFLVRLSHAIPIAFPRDFSFLSLLPVLLAFLLVFPAPFSCRRALFLLSVSLCISFVFVHAGVPWVVGLYVSGAFPRPVSPCIPSLYGPEIKRRAANPISPMAKFCSDFSFRFKFCLKSHSQWQKCEAKSERDPIPCDVNIIFPMQIPVLILCR